MGKKEEKDETVIGQGTTFKGTLELKQGLQVHGSLEGERIATEKVLVVGVHGIVKSQVIEVTDAVVSGHVTGSVKASGVVRLQEGSVFVGQIDATRLIVEEGALLRPG